MDRIVCSGLRETNRKLYTFFKGRRWKTAFSGKLTFLRLHWAYFISISLVGTLILYGICWTGADFSLSFIDSFYMIVSMVSLTGLSSVPVENIPVGGYVLFMLMMVLGGQVSTSIVPLFVKRQRYCRFVRHCMTARDEEMGLSSSNIDTGTSVVTDLSPSNSNSNIDTVTTGTGLSPSNSNSNIDTGTTGTGLSPSTSNIGTETGLSPSNNNINIIDTGTTVTGLASSNGNGNGNNTGTTVTGLSPSNSNGNGNNTGTTVTGLTSNGINTRIRLTGSSTVASLSNTSIATMKEAYSMLNRLKMFLGLSKTEDYIWMKEMSRRNEAGHLTGLFQEYRATVMLIKIVVRYYIVVHLLGFIVTWICIGCSPHAKRILKEKHINQGFFALFMTFSAFSNCGVILNNENMVVFQSSVLLNLELIAVVLLGNILYAPALRYIILILHRHAKGKGQGKEEVYEFLLSNPRKCYTHLFPRVTTYWLFLAVTGINVIQCIMFYMLDWGSKAMKGFSHGIKLLTGLFQAISCRGSGMNSINLADLSEPMLVLYCGFMYIAAYPVFLSRQTSRDRQEDEGKIHKDIHDTTISTQSKRLFANDWLYLFVSIFLICATQNNDLKRDPFNYRTFSVIFEVISICTVRMGRLDFPWDTAVP